MNSPLINVDLKQVRKFGFILTTFLLGIGLLSYFKEHFIRAYVMWTLSGFSLICSAFWVNGMKPVYRAAMRFALFMGFINSYILLTVIFYLIFTPISLVLRLLGKDLLHRKINTNANSYWQDRPQKPFNQKQYEYQF